MHKSLLVFIILLFITEAYGQNLIINGSFEIIQDSSLVLPCQYTRDGNIFSRAFLGWQSHHSVTVDALVVKSTTSNCFPIIPHSGNKMAGFIAYHPYADSGYSFDYHEMVGGSFKQPLEFGKKYRFSFWLYTDDSIGYKHLRSVLGNEAQKVYNVNIDSLDIRLSTTEIANKIHCSKLNNNPNYRPQFHVAISQNKVNQAIWKQYLFDFVADSSYQYFTIGNFKADSLTKTSISKSLSQRLDSINLGLFQRKNTKRVFFEKSKRIAYYLVDDFYCAPSINTAIVLTENQPYSMRSLVFSANKSEILPTSYPELDELYAAFEKMPLTSKLCIEGHTDNIGDEKMNLALSQKRSEAVASYLIKKGIVPNRLKIQGIGSSKPIASNDSEINRKLNRRVEVKIIHCD